MNMKENLGPAEHIIQTLLHHTDHLYHGRPGVVVPDRRTTVGVRWDPVTHKVQENGTKTVFRLTKVGRKNVRTPIGQMNGDRTVTHNGTNVGTYQPAGVFPQVAAWFYKQVAEVWKLDNEFAARWASFAWKQEHRDLKTVLTAFLLVQSRKGDPEREGGKVIFHDEDYRDVGEAMVLLQERGKDLNPKLILRVWEILNLPEVAAINHELGFGKSARKPFLGRWPKTVEKWMRYREENPKMLEGLVKAGFRNTVMALARRVGYKPNSDRFFDILRWKQKQADDGRRTMSIGKKVRKAESWEGLTERQVCNRVVKHKPNWKRIVGLLPKDIGITRAIMAVAIEEGCLSNKDLVIITPTLEELGLLEVQDIKERWQAAITAAEDMRAANIARNVRSKEVKEQLEEGADKAAQKAVEEVVKGLRVYFMVDISGSMQNALEAAKPLIAKFLQSFPTESVHVAVFNTSGREIRIRHASTKGVQQAFRGIRAGGGTDYGSGVRILQKFKPDDDEDTIMIFVGDEQAGTFMKAVRGSELNPLAFGLMRVVGSFGMGRSAVQDTATGLEIPCFMIDDRTFEDPYAIPRTIRNLVAATPIGERAGRRAAPRVTLVDQILSTDLLQKPAWA
jgi:hypothetical protein